METLQSIRNKIENAEAVQSVVTTMKAVASVNVRQFHDAVSSLYEYYRAVELGLQIVMETHGEDFFLTEDRPADRLGVILFGSDQGMVGQFNQVITQYALSRFGKMGIRKENRDFMVVGVRAASRLLQQGEEISEVVTMPGSLAGITPVVQELLVGINSWRESGGYEQVILFYNSPGHGASYNPVQYNLLPLDIQWLRSLASRDWPAKVIPTYRMDWQELFAGLIQEFFFVTLFRAFAESMAAENASRLASMQAAEENIEDRLEHLHQQYHLLRQSTIMRELEDIISGYEALSGGW